MKMSGNMYGGRKQPTTKNPSRSSAGMPKMGHDVPAKGKAANKKMINPGYPHSRNKTY